jgi:outer membrane protein TolC
MCHIQVTAQIEKANDPINVEIGSLLPPLDVLIDSALAHNPSVKFQELQILINNCEVKAQRMQWMRNMGFQTDVRYGTFNNFSTNTAEGQVTDLMASRSNQTNYGIGGYIKFPLFDFAGRKNQINLSQFELEQAKQMAEVQRNEVRQLVIKQYNDMILKHKLFRNKLKYRETSRISMEMAENEFKNGVIPIGEYSRISEIESRADGDYESARIDFITSYLILEEIVGVKFNLIDEKTSYENN